MYPFTYARAVGAAPAATPSKTGEVNQGKTEAQDSQGNAKAKNTKKQRGEAGSPGKNLAGGGLSGPCKTLAGAARPHQLSEPPLSPPTPNKRVGTGLGRHLRGGMQIFVKTKNSQDLMRIGRQQSSTGPHQPSLRRRSHAAADPTS